MSLPLWVEFFDELQNVRGRSKNTVMAYRRDLELFIEYRKKSSNIIGFYEFMRGKKLSTRSQARVISSLRTYFRFCESLGKSSPELRDLRLPKVKLNLPRVLSYNDFKKLFDACVAENPLRTARNQITLLLLFGLGVRVSELINLNLSDFHEADCSLRVTGKGNKQRLLPVTQNLVVELKDYIREVRSHLVKKGKIASILINDRGHRPSRIDVWRWLASWSSNAGFSETVHPHRFRHGCATALLEAGADLRSIQMLLGHSSIQSTQIYLSVSTKKMHQVVRDNHPLSKL
jgi:integrase/recombinase XerD